VQCYTLARRIFTELGLKRVALLRVNNRYGRLGVVKFRDAARRLGHPVVIEQKFLPGDTDFRRALRIIQDSRADAIVIWGDEAEAAGSLQQMRELGMKQRVFGSYRTLGDELLAQAGPAAEGFEAVFPYDPTRNDPQWASFNQRFAAQYGEKPEQFAALAYDAMNILLESICRAGLNRARIQDALDQVYAYDGVTGHMVFDPLNKNVSPMHLGTVRDGRITYRVARMDVPAEEVDASGSPASSHISQNQGDIGHPEAAMPYARVGEDGVDFAGPHQADVPAGAVKIVFFGPNAADAVQSEAVRAALGQQHWIALPVASDQNWGAATTQLVHALEDQHALAIVALDRDAAHLAEQMALKAFVPVVALANDRALTSTNVPWIFRLPAGTDPAQAIRLLVAAACISGNNSERLRGVLASGMELAGVRFRQTGETY
jgi:branched-chain amino acid transport system substrate-binding protein